jgi:alanine dehydrogenase
VSGCDLVVTATSSRLPVFDGAWIEEGTHISGIGANAPAKRELDSVTFERSRIVVDFRQQVLEEAGDLQEAIRTGAINATGIHAELAEIVTGNKRGRADDREVTLFKSVGMALEDVATASFVYQKALAEGFGTQIALDDVLPIASGVAAITT